MDIVQHNDKTCRRCKQTKPTSDFYRSSRRPDGLRDWCKACEKAAGQEYATKNKDKIDDNRRRYWDIPENRERRRGNQNQLYHKKHDHIRSKRNAAYRANPEPQKEQARLYREQNPDKVQESNRRTWQKKGHIYLAKNRQYRRANHADLLERQRQKYKQNPEPYRMSTRQRRAYKKNSAGTYTIVQWAALCDWFGNVCLACGESDALTVDHVIPLALGGSNSIDNIQPLCRSCNSSKKTKTTDYRHPLCLAAFLETLCGEY